METLIVSITKDTYKYILIIKVTYNLQWTPLLIRRLGYRKTF